MKKTLLQIVQDILSDISSDEVNSITDTVESQQVAQIVRSTYESMMTTRNWAHMRKLIQLDSLSDEDYPNYLRLPEQLKELVSLAYQCGTDKVEYKDLKYKEPDVFLRFVNARNSSLTNVQQITDPSGVKLLVINDQAPTYWTSFDDTKVVTDSWNSDVENTLQSSKSQAIAFIYPTWLHEDDFVPDLPIEAFPSLREEAKSTAFIALKQITNQKAEQEARRQSRWLARKGRRVVSGIRYPDYGRK